MCSSDLRLSHVVLSHDDVDTGRERHVTRRTEALVVLDPDTGDAHRQES